MNSYATSARDPVPEAPAKKNEKPDSDTQLAEAWNMPAKVGEVFAEKMQSARETFHEHLDSGHPTMDALCLRFGGFYRYAKILEMIAAGIASGEIRVPK